MSLATSEILWGVDLAGGWLGLIIWVSWIRLNPGRWGYAVAPLSWLVHVIVYFTARLAMSHEPSALFQLWSAALIGHALCLIIGIGLVWLYTRVTFAGE